MRHLADSPAALRVRQLRLERGLTQKELAELVGMSASEVSRLELVAKRPYIRTLHRLADGLGVNMTDLFPVDSRARVPRRSSG